MTWLRRLGGRRVKAPARRQPSRNRSRHVSYRPRTEWLEDRTLLSAAPPVLTALGTMNPTGLTDVNGTIFFAADDALWSTTGAPAATHAVKAPILQGGSDLSNLTNVHGSLFFTVDDLAQQPELWKSDGTAAGTMPLKTFDAQVVAGDPFTTSSYGIQDLTAVGATLFFTAYDPGHGRQLWESNGTAAGTVPVTDLNTHEAGGFNPTDLTDLDGTLYFAANDGIHGSELWASIGSAAGTHLVKAIDPGDGGSNPSSLTVSGSTLYFTADDGIHGRELWKSDGTAFGTTLVADINPGPADSSPTDLTAFEGELFFTAADGVHGRQVWKTDGTAQGTVQVTDIASSSAIPADLTPVNDALFFTAYEAVHGRELWKTDGAMAGTVLVRDMNPGSAPSDPLDLAGLDGMLYFTADDGVHGRELWSSDGTTQGTVPVADLASGPLPAFAAGTVSADGATWLDVNAALYFAAEGGPDGFELWKLSTGDSGPVAGPRFEDLAALVFASSVADRGGHGLNAPTTAFAVPAPPLKINEFPGLPVPEASWNGAGLKLDPFLEGNAAVYQANSPPPAPMATDTAPATAGVLLWATEGKGYHGPVATAAVPTTANAGSQYHALIDWGDGTTSTTGNVQVHGSQLGVDGEHTYTHQGSFPIHVQVEVDGTLLPDITGTATVVPGADDEKVPDHEAGPMSMGSAKPDAWASVSLAVASFAYAPLMGNREDERSERE